MEGKYQKDYDTWNEEKKAIEARKVWSKKVFQREIWWCSLGVNIGSEEDGKNDNHERPIIILRHISRDIVLMAPFTSTLPKNKFQPRIKTKKIDSTLKLDQIRTISKRRLMRIIDVVAPDQFAQIQNLLIEFISQKDGNPAQSGVSSAGPEAQK